MDCCHKGLEGVATPSWGIHKKLRSHFVLVHRLVQRGTPYGLTPGGDTSFLSDVGKQNPLPLYGMKS